MQGFTRNKKKDKRTKKQTNKQTNKNKTKQKRKWRKTKPNHYDKMKNKDKENMSKSHNLWPSSCMIDGLYKMFKH